MILSTFKKIKIKRKKETVLKKVNSYAKKALNGPTQNRLMNNDELINNEW